MTDENRDELTDDERQAAALTVSTSTNVGTAALATLAGTVALYTYITQNFAPSAVFYIAIAAGASSLVASLFAAGKGTNATAETVAKGTWAKNPPAKAFGCQALFTLLGLACVLLAVAIGSTSSRRSDDRIKALEHRVAQRGRQIETLQRQLESLAAQYKSLGRQVRRLKRP